jgi:protein O-mannosyl-transferase
MRAVNARRRAALAGALLVAVAVLLAFLPSLANGFAPIDDEKNFLLNPGYRGLGLAQLRWMFTSNHMGHYIPITWLTLGSDFLMWRLDPFGYHLTSLVFHLANALLFFALAWRLLARALPAGSSPALGACVAALAFGVHPLRVESVAWASERRDVVCGLFALLTLHAYVSAADSTGDRRRRFLALTYVAFTLALFSKGTALMLPLACLALDATLLGRLPGSWRTWLQPPTRAALVEKWIFVGPALISATATLLAIRYVLAPVAHLGLDGRLAAAAYGLTFYVQKTFVPFPLPLVVHWQPDVSLSTPAFALRALLVVACALVLWLVRRRAPALVAAVLVYAAFVLPVSGLLQAGPQLVAHRYSYLACLPFALLAGGLLARLAPRTGIQRAAWGVTLTAGAALVLTTRAQAALWHDPLTFCTRAAADSPLAWQPRYTLAAVHLQAGRWDAAARELRLGLAANPQATPLLNQAALLFATCPDARVRSGAEALLLAERLLRETPSRDPWAALTLSAALAETGDHAHAQMVAAQAQAEARRLGLVDLVGRLAAAQRVYDEGRPLRMQAADWGPAQGAN